MSDEEKDIFDSLLSLLSAEYTYGDGEVEWSNAFFAANNHSIVGITVDSLPKTVTDKAKSLWVTAAAKQLQIFHTLLKYQKIVSEALERSGVRYAVLKGTSAARYYPNPEYRSMADIDIIVHPEDFEAAETAVSEVGFKLTDKWTVGKRHSVFQKKGIHIELHHHFSHSSGSSTDTVDEYIRRGLENTQKYELYGYTFQSLPPVENGLAILYHISSQLFMGVGLRNIVDWCEYISSMPRNFWKNEFRDAAKKCGLEKFARILTGTCVRYLGLSEKDFDWCCIDEDICKALIDDCVSSGNDGFRNVSESSYTKASVKMSRRGGLKYLQQAGLYNWKYSHKHKWVRPFAWIYQIFRYIKKTISNRKTLKEEIELKKSREKLLKKVGL